MSRLLRAQEVACSPYLKITHSYFKTGTELGKLFYRYKTFLSDFTQDVLSFPSEVCVRPAARTPYPAPYLVELSKSHFIRVLDNQSICVWHVNSRFNYGCTYKDVYFSFSHVVPYTGKLFFIHLTVCYSNDGIRYDCVYTGGDIFDILYLIVQIEHLSSAPQFFFYGFVYYCVIKFKHIGLHRVSVNRSLLKQ